MIRLCAFIIPFSMVLCPSAGCNHDAATPTGSMHGTITYRGQPVANANILFQNTKRGWTEFSPIDEAGSYRIDGASVGEYTVSIEPIEPKGPDESTATPQEIRAARHSRANPSNIPPQYRSPHTSPLTANIGPGEKEVNFDLTKASQ